MFIHIKHGASRHVILYGDYAIKIARVTPLYLAILIYSKIVKKIKRSKPMVSKLKNESGSLFLIVISTFFRQVMHHIGLGIRVNRAEAAYWQKHKNSQYVQGKGPRYAPVKGMYLWGLILVQQRGERMTESELFRSSARRYTSDTELRRAYQWVWIDGIPCVIDYAHLEDPTLVFGYTPPVLGGITG